MNITNLPEDNKMLNIKNFLLDPLSVIIKLAIIGNKPIGTKLLIQNNVIYFQEPGVFQAVCRIFFNSNRSDLQYMYNPIQLACQHFLSKDFIQKTPRIKNLFLCAQNGLKKLMETYKNCSIITLCLNYYLAIITNYVEQKFNDNIFYKDGMTNLYSVDITNALYGQWSDEKIKLVLDIISFLMKDTLASTTVKSLENIMENIDQATQVILTSV
uniref:Uncharacterized protein n=1 Tax=viral metagenome TaxID=1070528 RepID=A0A6C0EPY6_9ZZZZ